MQPYVKTGKRKTPSHITNNAHIDYREGVANLA